MLNELNISYELVLISMLKYCMAFVGNNLDNYVFLSAYLRN